MGKKRIELRLETCHLKQKELRPPAPRDPLQRPRKLSLHWRMLFPEDPGSSTEITAEAWLGPWPDDHKEGSDVLSSRPVVILQESALLHGRWPENDTVVHRESRCSPQGDVRWALINSKERKRSDHYLLHTISSQF